MIFFISTGPPTIAPTTTAVVTPVFFTFNITQVNSVAVATSWSISSPVDYVQPQFRAADISIFETDGGSWTNGTQISGDRNTFVLNDLNQATSYDLRLIFYFTNSIPSIVTSTFIASTCETGVAGIDECTTGTCNNVLRSLWNSNVPGVSKKYGVKKITIFYK